VGKRRRWAAYDEIGDYSYSEYLYGFVLPYYRDRVGLVLLEGLRRRRRPRGTRAR
jgi:hypothetical protein